VSHAPDARHVSDLERVAHGGRLRTAVRGFEKGGDSVGSVAVHAFGDVGVDVEGDRRAGMSEAFLDHLDVDAVLQRERGPGVPEVVQADAGQAAGLPR